MQKLLNLTNYVSDNELIGNNSENIKEILEEFGFDGLELMFCGPWDSVLHPKEIIKGCHLPFYPNWLDFWLGNKDALEEEFGGVEGVRNSFGADNVDEWIEVYGKQIEMAAEANPPYMVFHVSNARFSETFTWDFHYSDDEVLRETVLLPEALERYIPDETWLLLENLWWPGLRLTDPSKAEYLLNRSPHGKTGFMLDTGHLLSTNQNLRTELEGIQYITEIVKGLGSMREMIKGIHLHQSFSGDFLHNWNWVLPEKYDPISIGQHVGKIDYHASWTIPEVGSLVEFIDPEWLVFEFLQRDIPSWKNQIEIQLKALEG